MTRGIYAILESFDAGKDGIEELIDTLGPC